MVCFILNLITRFQKDLLSLPTRGGFSLLLVSKLTSLEYFGLTVSIPLIISCEITEKCSEIF